MDRDVVKGIYNSLRSCTVSLVQFRSCVESTISLKVETSYGNNSCIGKRLKKAKLDWV